MADTDGTKADVYRGFIVTDEETVSLVPELKASDKDEIGGASKQIQNTFVNRVLWSGYVKNDSLFIETSY